MQINHGVLVYLDDNEHGPEKLVVILDCRGATALQVSVYAPCLLFLCMLAFQVSVSISSRSCLQATKLVRLMKSVAVTLNQHYPSRLHQLFFVEPPAVMKWPIQAAKPLLHAETGNKIQVCSLDDPALPVHLRSIPDAW